MANILIIDDDQSVTQMLSRVVSGMGHRVSAASTVSEGLAISSSACLDVVFLDVMLPDGNGLELIETLRGVESQPDIIIITGAGDPERCLGLYRKASQR